MRFIVDVTPETVDIINGLIKKGEYRTVQEFISIAIQNQTYLLEHPDSMVETYEQIHTPEKGIEADPKKNYRQFLAINPNEIKLVSLPNSEQTSDIISGLWNKYLPVKITVRVLANMLKDGIDSVLLDQLQDNASIVAREFGLSLIKSEKGLDRKRGEKLSTALPTKRSEFKSRMRFKTHFVGSLSRNRIDGMPATLGLINVFRGKDGQILVGLTEIGLKFARMENPVLDKNDLNSSFSIEERQFLLGIIETRLPNELRDIKLILNIINSGIFDSKELSKEISKLKPKLEKNELVSFKSGILSRLIDLGLVKRMNRGLASQYEVIANDNLRILIGGS
jgi:hypothetical protein